MLPRVVTDVLNPAYWPDCPWRELHDPYDVRLPKAYWPNRADGTFSDRNRYVTENIERVRRTLRDGCAAVSVFGGYDVREAADDHRTMRGPRATSTRSESRSGTGPTPPPSAWPAVRGHDVTGR